jgi:ketosteroid isomerase-like protein
MARVERTNVEVARWMYDGWGRGDYSSAEWAHPEIEYVIADGPCPGRWIGLAGMAEECRDFLSAWEEHFIVAEEYLELDSERVLVLDRRSGRGKSSGVELAEMRSKGAALIHVRDGKVTRLAVYWVREHVLTDLGLLSGDESLQPCNRE